MLDEIEERHERRAQPVEPPRDAPFTQVFVLIVLLATLLGVIARPVEAATATSESPLRWEVPTAHVDGSPLALSDIQSWRISVGRSSGVYDVAVFDIPQDGSESHDLSLDLGEVSDSDVVDLYIVMQTVTANEISEYSNEERKTFTVNIGAVPPDAPVILEWDLSVDCVAGPGFSCSVTVGG